MTRIMLSAALILCLAVPVLAGPGGSTPIADGAKRLAAQTSPQRAFEPKRTNTSQLIAGLTLIGAGAGVAIYGLTHVTGAEITGGCTGYYCDNYSLEAKEKHNTTLGYVGLGIAGAGTVLALTARHSVGPTPQGAGLQYRFKF